MNNFDDNREEEIMPQNAPGQSEYDAGEGPELYRFSKDMPAYEAPEPLVKKKKSPPFWLGILVGLTAGLVIVLVTVIVMGLRTIRLVRPSSAQTGSEVNAQTKIEQKLNTLQAYIDMMFLWEIDPDRMEEAMADGMIAGLNDKYARYYTPKEFASLMESTEGEYAGIGVSIIQTDDNRIQIYKVNPGSPAERAGLHVGDYIIEAAGETTFEDLDALVDKVRGEPGTTVDIVLDRDGEKIPVTVERAKIQTLTVEHEMLENDIGYIYISEFDVVTVSQFNEALDDLEAQGMKSLIIDLRDNPGGDYDTVVAMADRVLPEGPIMTVKDKNGTIKTENSDNRQYLDLPMVIIINQHSASAAEVFTGAIDDYDMATIVGVTSYGKGIVQGVFGLYDGSGVQFTTEEYFTPSGDSIHGIGITPDVIVELPEGVYEDGILEMEEDTQLQKAIEILSGK